MGFAEAKQPWKAEEILQVMTEFEVQPEKSTMLLVTEAWRAAGMTEEASRILGTINKKEMTSQKETGKSNTSRKHRETVSKANSRCPCSNILQNPSTVTSDHKGSPATHRKGRMVLRDDDFSVECSWLATRNMSLPHSCRFWVRLPIICRKQSQAQPGLSGQLAQSCTAVFLN